DIGWSRTTDGVTWSSRDGEAQQNLPGLTAQSPRPNGFFERASDTTVAYSAKWDTWWISSIPLEFNTLAVPTVFVSRSTDDGVPFQNPVSIPPPPVKKVDLD